LVLLTAQVIAILILCPLVEHIALFYI